MKTEQLLWEIKQLSKQQDSDQQFSFPHSRWRINFNKNVARLQVSLKNQTIHYSSSIKYSMWKLSIVLSYSDLISLILNVVLFIQMPKMIALSYKQIDWFRFKSIYEDKFKWK